MPAPQKGGGYEAVDCCIGGGGSTVARGGSDATDATDSTGDRIDDLRIRPELAHADPEPGLLPSEVFCGNSGRRLGRSQWLGHRGQRAGSRGHMATDDWRDLFLHSTAV